MTRTRKPCPACKKVVHHRAADDICANCITLIEEALSARKSAEPRDTELVRLPWAPHGMEYIAHAHSYQDDGDYGHNIQSAIWKILKALTTEAPWRPGLGELPVVIGGADRYKKPVRMQQGLRPLFDQLYANIRKATDCSYEQGYRDGENMIARLAKGELSIEKFNKIASGGAK